MNEAAIEGPEQWPEPAAAASRLARRPALRLAPRRAGPAMGGAVAQAARALRRPPPPPARDRKLYCRGPARPGPARSPCSFTNSARPAGVRGENCINERAPGRARPRFPRAGRTTHWRPFTRFLTTTFYARTREQTDRRPRHNTTRKLYDWS